jgi:hypothetical protein
MNAFEAALLARGTANMTELLDVAAAADYFLATEVTKNPDGYRGSIKMYKDRAGPLVIGPLWVSSTRSLCKAFDFWQLLCCLLHFNCNKTAAAKPTRTGQDRWSLAHCG